MSPTEHTDLPGRDGLPRLLTVAEVAEMAEVSKMTIYRMVHATTLPALRVGGSFRIRLEDARALLRQRGEWD